MSNDQETEVKSQRASRPGKRGTLPNIKGLLLSDIQQLVVERGEPKFRAEQIASWVFEKGIASFDEMSNLSKNFRTSLEEHTSLTNLELVTQSRSRHSPTTKFLFGLEDGQTIESVLIASSRRNTLCISSQVGCAIDCKFCASGVSGLARNLSAGEIVDQVIQARRLVPTRPPTNIVLMGMGEPLANYDNVLRAVRIINADWGLGIGARKITLSTSGLAPKIRQLAREDLQFELSVSLHAADDRTRSTIMPINRRYPLEELMEACRTYMTETGRLITFEYVLLKGINDRFEDAARLAALMRSMKAKINLIPYNPVEGLSFETPDDGRQMAFIKILQTGGVTATIRRERGRDIDAACGQLRLKQTTANKG